VELVAINARNDPPRIRSSETFREKSVMKRLWRLLVLLVVMLLCAPADAEVFGGIDFPQNLGGFVLRSTHDYEKTSPGLGTSLFYSLPGVTVTVYVYGQSQYTIPDGIDSSLVRQHFSQVRREVQQVHHDAQILIQQERVSLAGVPALHATFELSDMEKDSHEIVSSHLYLMAQKGNFIKVRASYRKANPPENGDRAQLEFVGALGQLLSK
jgi:hypothetical protein